MSEDPLPDIGALIVSGAMQVEEGRCAEHEINVHWTRRPHTGDEITVEVTIIARKTVQRIHLTPRSEDP